MGRRTSARTSACYIKGQGIKSINLSTTLHFTLELLQILAMTCRFVFIGFNVETIWE